MERYTFRLNRSTREGNVDGPSPHLVVQLTTTWYGTISRHSFIMAASIVQNVLLKAAEDEAEKLRSIQVDKVVELEFDLGNLLAYDINDLEVNQLR